MDVEGIRMRSTINWARVEEEYPRNLEDCIMLIGWDDGDRAITTGYWNGHEWLTHGTYTNFNVLAWDYEEFILEGDEDE